MTVSGAVREWLFLDQYMQDLVNRSCEVPGGEFAQLTDDVALLLNWVDRDRECVMASEWNV